MNMKNNDIIQQLSDHLFWDIKREEIEVVRHRQFIITRTMDRGTAEDVRLVWNYYGEEAVKNALLNAPSIERKTIFFFANQFHISPENFRSYHKNRKLDTWNH